MDKKKTPTFTSRLPDVGTTIFTVMSALASEKKAINLGQGFPDFSCDRHLLEMVNEAMHQDQNQYPPMAGVSELRQEIAHKIKSIYRHQYDPVDEITVTAGGTQGIFTAVMCCVSPGDEVIVIEPAYDSYIPAIQMAQGVPIRVALEVKRDALGKVESYQIPWKKIEGAITEKTRLIMINSPHNPTGMIWKKEDLNHLADIVHGTEILVLSDEVYEHMVYDQKVHESVSSHPELVERSFVISSFGKTYHVTGWKVGYVAAPKSMTSEFRKVHQFNVFTVNTPVQYGLSNYLKEQKHYLGLSNFYEKKRNFFQLGLRKTRFQLLPSEGTYFQCADYTGLNIPEAKLNESDFCCWLTSEIGVAAIPLSAFYTKGQESGVIRFCFAKQEKTLEEAITRLYKL